MCVWGGGGEGIMTTKLIEPIVQDPALEHAHLTDDLYL